MTKGNVLACTTIILNTSISCEKLLLLIKRIFFFGTLSWFDRLQTSLHTCRPEWNI